MNNVVKIDAHEVGRVDRALDQLYDHPDLGGPARLIAPGPARLAIYDSPSGAPDVEEVRADGPAELIGLLATRAYEISQEKGGRIPFAAIKEVVENLVHADFAEVVVSILQGGNLIKVSDQGPGFADKTRALQPGYTSAAGAVKHFIKGVGSGLSVASGALVAAGGTLKLEDNVKRGAVVTLTVPAAAAAVKEKAAPGAAPPRLTKRQKKVVFLVLEVGSVGPSRIATELSVGLSTAYRDLQALENTGLIKCDQQGKRSLTDYGIDSIDAIING